jgi:1-acyl-sn-glycerol-3-phosphate acyltransferase
MLYALLKIIIRPASKIFCRKIVINNPWLLKEKGPLLLACNHPNSFLDAVILDMLFDEPIWSLTRGDVFLSNPVNNILFKLKMLPVYRPSEGVENLSENYKTFETCIDIFRRNGVVLIFSEGLCVNEWHLRPLKKGTARLAIRCQDENIPLKILPVGINYSSFRRFGKNIFINFGNLFSMDEFDKTLSDGQRLLAFNNLLLQELKPLVFEIEKRDKERQKVLLGLKTSLLKKYLFCLPAALGFLIHWPLYLPIKKWVHKKFGSTVHVDALQIALPLFMYPLYLLLLVFLLFLFIKSWWVLLFLLFIPFTAWSYVLVKGQMD